MEVQTHMEMYAIYEPGSLWVPTVGIFYFKECPDLQPKEVMMNHWKTLACTALLFPAMAVAQPAEPGPPGAQPPGMQEQPGEAQPGMEARPGEEREHLSSLGPGQFLANDLIGQPVRSRNGVETEPGQPGMGTPGMGMDEHEGQEVGTVEDLILDQQGQVVGIVISRDHEGATERGVGEAAGLMGENGDKVALSWEAIEVQQDPEDPDAWIVFTDIDPQGLEGAPEFEDDHDEGNGIL